MDWRPADWIVRRNRRVMVRGSGSIRSKEGVGPGHRRRHVDRWMDGGWLVCGRTDDGSRERWRALSAGSLRYDPLKALVRTTELEFSHMSTGSTNRSPGSGQSCRKASAWCAWMWRNPNTKSLACRRRDPIRQPTGGLVLKCQPPAGTAATASLPSVDSSIDSRYGFCPKGANGVPVIRNVHIVKTFGGEFPWFPAGYVGTDRFAVTKTVKDEVELPKDHTQRRRHVRSGRGGHDAHRRRHRESAQAVGTLRLQPQSDP